jgi:hypothetical protein
MHKYIIVIKVFLYYIIITVVATSLSLTVSGGSIYGFQDLTPGMNLEYMRAVGFLIMGLFGFGVTTIPPIISTVFFWLPGVILLLYILGLIRGND